MPLETLFARFVATRASEFAEAVHRAAQPRLRLYAATMLRDPNDVDDVVQDTFVTAFECPEAWDLSRPLLPWLCGILRHRALNHGRAERRRRRRESCESAAAAPPIEALEAEEVMREVQHGIAALARTYREVVGPTLLEGVTTAEIALRLGRTENTVRVQLSRGLRMLRDALPVGISAALALALLPGRGAAASTSSGVTTIAPTAARAARQGWRARRIGLVALAAVVPLCVAMLAGLGRGDDPTPIAPARIAADTSQPAERTADAERIAVGTIAADTVAPARPARVEVELVLGGKPAANAQVSLAALRTESLFVSNIVDAFGSRRAFEMPSDPDVQSVWTDREGRAAFAPPRGSWLIVVPGDGIPITVDGSTPRSLRFELRDCAARVSGRVVDANGDEVASDLWMSSSDEAPALSRRLHCENGRFEFVALRGSRIQARRANGCSEPCVVTGASSELRFELRPATTLAGTVRDRERNGIAGATIEITDGELRARTRSDHHGRFAFDGVVDGNWQIRARTADTAIASSQLRLPSCAREPVDLVLHPAATIIGRALDDRGMPVAYTRVAAGWNPGDLDYVATSTGPEGNFRLIGVDARQTRVQAGLGPDGFVCASFAPVAGETLSWNPVLSRRDLVIAGHITSARAPAELAVTLDAVDHFKPQATALEGGHFSFAIPEFAVGRSFALRVYDAAALAAQGIRATMPLAVFEGLTPGNDDLELRIEGPAGADSSLHLRIDPRGVTPGAAIRLWHRDLGHWIEAGEVRTDATLTALDFERLPAGRYELSAAGSSARHSFELGSGQDLDLGVLDFETTPTPAAAPAPLPIRLNFEHPNDDTPMGRLQCRIWNDRGTEVGNFGAPGTRGTWHGTAALPPGKFRVEAHTAEGLVGGGELNVDTDGPRTATFHLARSR